MQIVINLDEDIYTRLFDNGTPISLADEIVIERAIRAGIVLPKGHGRLIDAEILIKDMKNGINAGLLIDGYEKYTNINSVDDCVFCVECADTVLEANKEQESEFKKKARYAMNESGYLDQGITQC